ncbi:MAG: hypothetical protein ABI203_04510 [Mucilaginibacter sp.]
MKTFKLTFILLMFLAAISCKKTDDSASLAVTSDQAADMAAGSLSENSFGLTSVTDNLAANAQVVASVKPGSQTVNAATGGHTHQECGTTLKDSLTNSGTNSSVSFSYFLKFARTLNCNSNQAPDNLYNVIAFHGNYDGPHIISADAGSATFTIAGLSLSANSYVVNGEYKRTGSFTTKSTPPLTGNSNIDIVVTNLTLSKSTRIITSGNATISVTGSTPKKGAFSYIGTLLFNGDGTATLAINGNNYNINLSTGIRTKA